MNKTELTAALAENTGLSKADAGKTIAALFDAEDGLIAKTCRGGEKVVLTGFGTFEEKTQAARKGVNPSTGAPLSIPEKKVVKFKPGTGLRK